ncbi:hypothetical protein EBZ38_12880 [bacterium]|nr:hypothetical protein [bacterium]
MGKKKWGKGKNGGDDNNNSGGGGNDELCGVLLHGGEEGVEWSGEVVGEVFDGREGEIYGYGFREGVLWTVAGEVSEEGEVHGQTDG